jgi:hypothetical protein
MENNIYNIEKSILDIIESQNSIEIRSRIEGLPIEKQRGAMLSLLCSKKDIEIKTMLKNISSIDRISELDKVIERIRKYNPVGEIEKKSFGEIFTPFSLINEMLDTLPIDVWNNPNLKWGDFCNGVGNFMVIIIKRLMIGLEAWEPNQEKRYKHIIENMIYVAELQIKNMFLWMVSVDPKNEFKLNLYRGNSLEKEFDLFMKDEWKVEKFDIIVGNPPYQDSESESDAGKLYIDFTKKSIKLSNDIIIFVTPETIVRDGRNKFNIKNEKGLCYVNHKSNDFFKVGVTIVSWVINKKVDSNHIKIVNRDGTVDYRNKNDSLVDFNELSKVKLFERLKKEKSKLFIIDQSGNNWSKIKLDGLYKVNKNVNNDKIEYTNIKPKLYGRKKLVISMSKSYDRKNLYESYDDFGELHVMLDITDYSDEQVTNVKKFLFNPICVGICNNYKKIYKKGFNSMLYLFPQIDINKKYTNDDVKNLFKLSDNDVEYLTKNI